MGKPRRLEENVSEDSNENGVDEEENFSEAKREYEEMHAELVELLSLQEKKLQAVKERFEVLQTTFSFSFIYILNSLHTTYSD